MNEPLACEVQLEELIQRAECLFIPSSDPIQVRSLAGDGSDRRFFRITKGRNSFVGLISPRRAASGMDENDSYELIGRHLYLHKLPVPRFYWSDSGRGLFLEEDVGDSHLQGRVHGSDFCKMSLYRRVLKLLLQVHKHAPNGFERSFCFDSAFYSPEFVYHRELEYFRKAFLLSFLKIEVTEEDLRYDFECLAETAGTHDNRFVIHRDFQSRNILIQKGSFRLVDFQGMRYGPPEYDLASLLVDPYVNLPEHLQESLEDLYWTGIRHFAGYSYSRFRERYFAVRLCRNLQILGAYGYLGIVKGKAHFLRYIPRAWRQLLLWINGPCKGKYPRLQELVNSVSEAEKVRGSLKLRAS